MTLPTLIAYDPPVPPLVALPASRADWPLERDRAALLVHDLQGYFLRPYATGCPAMTGALAATARLLEAARSAGVPVFYTAQRGGQDPAERGLQRELWGPGMSTAPHDTEIARQVAPQPSDTVLVKHRYSAFARSDLAGLLRAGGRDQLLIAGVYAHIGVLATALEAFQREVRPFVVADAVADFDAAHHRRALEQVAACCGVVMSAETAIGRLVPVDAGPAVDRYESALLGSLRAALGDPAAALALADPEADLFTLGLSSLSAFTVLDDLADLGVEVEFGEFVRQPTLAYLRSHGSHGAVAPAGAS